MKLSDDLQISLTVAVSEAGRLGHEYAGLEHLLYALTFDDETAEVLRHAGADIDRVRDDAHRVPLRRAGVEVGRRPAAAPDPRRPARPLACAAARADSSGKDEIDGADVLVAMFDEPDSYAIQVLESEGVTRLDVVSYHRPRRLAHRSPPTSAAGPRGRQPAGDEDDEDEEPAGAAAPRRAIRSRPSPRT